MADDMKISPLLTATSVRPSSANDALSRATQSSKKGDSAAIDKAAREFEGLLIQQMLAEMWKTVPEGGIGGKSHEQELFRGMLNEAVAKEIADGQGIGVRDVVARDIQRLDKKTK